MIFEETFSHVIFILLADQISLPDYVFFLRYWLVCVTKLFVCQSVTSYILRLTLAFLIKPFSYMTKTQDKNLNILRAKRAFIVKCKAFFIIYKGFQLSEKVLDPRVDVTQVLDVHFARSAGPASWVPFFSTSPETVNINLKLFNFRGIIAQILPPAFEIDYAPNLLVFNL